VPDRVVAGSIAARRAIPAKLEIASREPGNELIDQARIVNPLFEPLMARACELGLDGQQLRSCR
jgi:hypothetical protein